MVTVICDKTGVQFEAASKRQKNHPRVSGLLNEAAKSGTYGIALKELAACKADHMTDIDAVIARVDAVMHHESQVMNEAAVQRERERREREARRRAAYQERQYTNGILYEGGYHWSNLGFADEEEADAFGLIGPQYEYLQRPDWHLYASDNREVSVRQAMQEMASNGSFKARRWLEEHHVAIEADAQPQVVPEPTAEEVERNEAHAQIEEAARVQAAYDFVIDSPTTKEGLRLNEQAVKRSDGYMESRTFPSHLRRYDLGVRYTWAYYNHYAWLLKTDNGRKEA
jgi:hypothetical protein